MLLVFMAIIAMINGILSLLGGIGSINEWIANNSTYDKLSLEAILDVVVLRNELLPDDATIDRTMTRNHARTQSTRTA